MFQEISKGKKKRDRITIKNYKKNIQARRLGESKNAYPTNRLSYLFRAQR